MSIIDSIVGISICASVIGFGMFCYYMSDKIQDFLEQRRKDKLYDECGLRLTCHKCEKICNVLPFTANVSIFIKYGCRDCRRILNGSSSGIEA